MYPLLISYDLDKGGTKNYAPLEDRLLTLGAKRVLFSQWFLASSLSAELICEDLLHFIDARTDRLLITEIVRNNIAHRNLMIGDGELRSILNS